LGLSCLAPEDAQRLAATLLAERELDPAHAQAIADESGGSPFLVHELAWHGAPGPVDLGELTQRRVSRLAEPAQRLLEVVAVTERPVEPQLAAHAAGIGDQLTEALATLKSERLV